MTGKQRMEIARRKIKTYQHKVFFIRDILRREKVKLMHCKTEQMIGDYFTKPLQGSLFKKLRNYIMGHTDIPDEERVETNTKM